MNSMFRKELRDALRWLPIGAILVTVLIWYVLLRSPNFYERLSSELFFVVWISSAVFGFFLSLTTFLPDDREAARAFLVHRGVPIKSIYWTRILVGLLIYFSVMFAPLGFASLYLASIGPDYAPVSAIQVIPACFAVVYCTAFYFAGIIVACRPSHWLGTRILPIAAAIATALASTGLLISELMYTPIPLFLGAIGLFVLTIASCHTFTQLPPRIAPAAGVIRSRSLQLTLLVSSVLAVSTLCMLPINWVDNTPHEHQLIEFSKDGEPWLTTRPYRYQQSNKVSKRIRMTNDSSSANAASVPATAFEAGAGTMLQDPNWHTNPWDSQPISMRSDTYTYCFYDNSGYILVYQLGPNGRLALRSVVGRDRISAPDEPRGLPFRSLPRALATLSNQSTWYGGTTRHTELYSQTPDSRGLNFTAINKEDSHGLNFTAINKEGVYRIDFENRKVETLIEQELSRFGEAQLGRSRLLVLCTKDEAVVYRSEVANNNEFTGLIRDGSLSPQFSKYSHTFFLKDSANWTQIVGDHRFNVSKQYEVTRSIDSKVDSYTFKTPVEIQRATAWSSPEIPIVMSALPPAFLSVAIAVSSWNAEQTFENWHLAILFGQALVASCLAFAAAWRRGLSTVQSWCWIVAGLFLGLGTGLAILAIYPQVVTVPCLNCNRRRRVEHETCEHCGAVWEQPEQQGIEIFDESNEATNSAPMIAT